MSRKYRRPFGAGHHNINAKVSELDVAFIRILGKLSGWTERRLAHEFGLSNGAIHNILAGKTWVTVDADKVYRRAMYLLELPTGVVRSVSERCEAGTSANTLPDGVGNKQMTIQEKGIVSKRPVVDDAHTEQVLKPQGPNGEHWLDYWGDETKEQYVERLKNG